MSSSSPALGSQTPSSSRFAHFVKRMTPTNSISRSSSSNSLKQAASPGDSDDGEMEMPEFLSKYMNSSQQGQHERAQSSLGFNTEVSSLRKSSSFLSTTSSIEAPARVMKRRQSEEGTAASPYKDSQRHQHRRSPTAAALSALGLSGWNKSKDALNTGLKRENSVKSQPEEEDNNEQEELTRPPLTRLPSFETTQTQSTNSNQHKTPGGTINALSTSTGTNGTVTLGAGLSESSKRFRSAFRMRSKADGSSLRKPRRVVGGDLNAAVDNNGIAEVSDADGSPEDHAGYNSTSASNSSPEDLALARSMDRVQLVEDAPTSRTNQNASRPSVDTLRPVFNSSRLQSRLEAASLVPSTNNEIAPPIPVKSARRSPPYGSLRTSPASSPSPPHAALPDNLARASFDIPRIHDVPAQRSSVDIPRRQSPTHNQLPSKRSVDFRREAAIIAPSALAPRSNEQPLRVFADIPEKQEPSPEYRSHRPNGSVTLRGNFQDQNQSQRPSNGALRIHADAENIPPQNQRPVQRSENALGLKKQVSTRPPLGDLQPSRQNAPNGPTPFDRVVPVKPASATPPLDRFNSLPDLPGDRPPPSAPLPTVPSITAPPQSAAASTGTVRKAVQVVVNGKQYLRSALIGKGGSSRVYRITDRDHNVFAFKRVELGRGDFETYTSFCNEIELLKRLRGHDRIIQLVDAEVNEAKKTLVMVLEIGEIDLNSLLQEQIGKRVSMNFIRQTWEQMLECVKVVHDAGIVHTDLKPANFVLVKGALKLIDFGIAKAIPSDTTNIARDQQIGTANYMSPEALCDSGRGIGGERLMKMGRASDVWSLGCILYQMVYGTTPFGHFRNLPQKMMAIQNPLHVIAFPSHAIPKSREGVEQPDVSVRVEDDLLRVLKSCLLFDSKQRSTIPELLEDAFLRGGSHDATPISAQLVSAMVARTLQWANGRQPSRTEQERFVENMLLHLANPSTELGRLAN